MKSDVFYSPVHRSHGQCEHIDSWYVSIAVMHDQGRGCISRRIGPLAVTRQQRSLSDCIAIKCLDFSRVCTLYLQAYKALLMSTVKSDLCRKTLRIDESCNRKEELGFR